MPTDIKFYQPFGGEKVVFEKEEVTEMKKFGEPGIWHFEVLPSAHYAYMYACAAPLIGLDCEYICTIVKNIILPARLESDMG